MLALDHGMECLSRDERSDNVTHGKKQRRPLSPAPAVAIDQKATNDRPARVSKSVDTLIRGDGVLPKSRTKERKGVRMNIADGIAREAGLNVSLMVPAAMANGGAKQRPARNRKTQTAVNV